MRKLVTIRTIDNITPIEGADKIECLHIGGWTVVEQKDKFYIGQKVLFFEEDSLLPLDHCYFKPLARHGITKFNGKEYFRIKAIKLRGQVSQGLVFPYEIFEMNWRCDWNDELQVPKPTVAEPSPYLDPDECTEKVLEIITKNDGDYSNYFGVVKYEPPQKFDSSGAKLLPFPTDLPKSDQERIQNFEPEDFNEIIIDREAYVATEKLDGTSATIWAKVDDEGVLSYGVCSRNNGIEENDDNTYWKIAKTPSIMYADELLSPLDYLKQLCLEQVRANTGSNTAFYALQGELIGERIQKNPLGVKGHLVKFFDFFKEGKKLSLENIENDYPELAKVWVPLHPDKLEGIMSSIVEQPNGVKTRLKEATKATQIEGFVWRHIRDAGRSFKTISSEYLLEKGE